MATCRNDSLLNKISVASERAEEKKVDEEQTNVKEAEVHQDQGNGANVNEASPGDELKGNTGICYISFSHQSSSYAHFYSYVLCKFNKNCIYVPFHNQARIKMPDVAREF